MTVCHSPQARDPSLQLSDSCGAVCVIRDESLEPAAKLVLLLDDVVSDGAAAVSDRLVPPAAVSVNKLPALYLCYQDQAYRRVTEFSSKSTILTSVGTPGEV